MFCGGRQRLMPRSHPGLKRSSAVSTVPHVRKYPQCIESRNQPHRVEHQTYHSSRISVPPLCFPFISLAFHRFRGLMLPRRILKLLLGLLIGFWLGLLLGCLSSMMMWILLPEQWLANGIADRRARHEALLQGRECKVRSSVSFRRISVCPA